ncbi:ATP-dependent Clp protease adapter protein clpS [Zostera marina]|uniref:ATP-dependent Clp protease adapter protein clpS n=1 Tax=Zostera marina TaxID=29655 RepID=A0A0K9NZ73_ZOSMR|nr:ATP-dependent Clp protease adapter protein clpS [Zostera marina]
MATATCGRIALSSQTHILNPKSGEKLLSPYKRNFINTAVLMAISAAGGGPGKGGGLLEKPAVEKATPGRESEFDLRKKRKTSPPYRVLLHNDNFNKREYVVQVLMKVIPEMTLDIAVNVMQEAHLNGMAVVIICAQVDAEEHCMQLRGNGLLSSIEPGGASC